MNWFYIYFHTMFTFWCNNWSTAFGTLTLTGTKNLYYSTLESQVSGNFIRNSNIIGPHFFDLVCARFDWTKENKIIWDFSCVINLRWNIRVRTVRRGFQRIHYSAKPFMLTQSFIAIAFLYISYIPVLLIGPKGSISS